MSGGTINSQQRRAVGQATGRTVRLVLMLELHHGPHEEVSSEGRLAMYNIKVPVAAVTTPRVRLPPPGVSPILLPGAVARGARRLPSVSVPTVNF